MYVEVIDRSDTWGRRATKAPKPETLTLFICTKYSRFCPYSEKHNIPAKLLTRRMKTNERSQRSLFDRANAASLFRSFCHLLEKVGVAIFAHVDIQVFRNVSFGRASLPQPCKTVGLVCLQRTELNVNRQEYSECTVYVQRMLLKSE